MPTPQSTKTLGDLNIYVKRQFGDESGVQITDSDITRWANQAQVEIVSNNPMIQTTANQSTVVGQATYDINTIAPTMLQLEAVLYDGWPLEPTTIERMKADLGPDSTMPGSPQYFYVWANTIYLWPVPNAVKPLQVNYSSMPVEVSVTSDFFGIPDRYYDRICEYVMSKAYELDEDWGAHTVQRQTFEDKMSALHDADKNQIGSFPVAYDSEYE